MVMAAEHNIGMLAHGREYRSDRVGEPAPPRWCLYYLTLSDSRVRRMPREDGDRQYYARCGKGAYVFTALSWFRELPAGVPGAYRIFANFLSAGKTL